MVAAGQLPVSDEDGRKKKIISLKDIIWVVLSSNPLIDIDSIVIQNYYLKTVKCHESYISLQVL